MCLPGRTTTVSTLRYSRDGFAKEPRGAGSRLSGSTMYLGCCQNQPGCLLSCPPTLKLEQEGCAGLWYDGSTK